MNIGDTAPDFTLKDGNGEDWTLSDHHGKIVVLMFYPGDDTPVCTKEMCSVRDHWSDYQATGAEVVGISTDSVESHDKFAQKYDLPLRAVVRHRRQGPRPLRCEFADARPHWTGRVCHRSAGKLAYQKVRPIGLFRPSDDDVLAAIKDAGK